MHGRGVASWYARPAAEIKGWELCVSETGFLKAAQLSTAPVRSFGLSLVFARTRLRPNFSTLAATPTICWSAGWVSGVPECWNRITIASPWAFTRWGECEQEMSSHWLGLTKVFLIVPSRTICRDLVPSCTYLSSIKAIYLMNKNYELVVFKMT